MDGETTRDDRYTHPETGFPLHGSSAQAKLRAALDYLGDKLSTHQASRFKPAKRYLLDQWFAARSALIGLELEAPEPTTDRCRGSTAPAEAMVPKIENNGTRPFPPSRV
jgi:hypothetical protein